MNIASGPPNPNHACPVCGGANACAPARSGSFDTPCWCTSVTIPAANIRGSEDRASCLCMRCATASATT